MLGVRRDKHVAGLRNDPGQVVHTHVLPRRQTWLDLYYGVVKQPGRLTVSCRVHGLQVYFCYSDDGPGPVAYIRATASSPIFAEARLTACPSTAKDYTVFAAQ